MNNPSKSQFKQKSINKSLSSEMVTINFLVTKECPQFIEVNQRGREFSCGKIENYCST